MPKLTKPKNKRHTTPKICLTCKSRQTEGPHRWYCEREVEHGQPAITYRDTDARLVHGLSTAVRQTCDRWKESTS